MQPPSGTTDSYPQPGEVLDGRYRIDGLLAEGGMGAVLKATHLLRRATVAIKFMSAKVRRNRDADQRFVNEAVAASRIDSDHVVKVLDVARLPDGAPYLVMEFLDGRDLGDLLEREGPKLEPARAVHLTLQVLRALQTAHAAGIVHRDVKPSNCFVIEKEGEADFVKVVDFGISKVRVPQDEAEGAGSLTGTNTVFGTPLYMSPEQARSSRDVDLRTDLYSVGAVLYEMLSGRTPYAIESDQNIFYQVFMTDPDPLKTHCPELPDGLVDAVHRALEREPEARFGSAVEMALALAPFSDTRSTDVLGWLLGSRGRSLVPAGFGSIRPADANARAAPHEAMARTTPAGSIDASGRLLPTPHASAPPASRPPVTDTGVAREAGDSPIPSPPRSTRVGVAIAAAALGLTLSGTGLLAVRRCDPKTEATSTPVVTAPVREPPVAAIPLPTDDGSNVRSALDAATPSPPPVVAAASSPTPARSSRGDTSNSGARPSPPLQPPPTIAPTPTSRIRQTGLAEEYHP